MIINKNRFAKINEKFVNKFQFFDFCYGKLCYMLEQNGFQSYDEKLLTLEREIQNLRLELTERDQLIDKLKQQLEQQRTSENTNIDSAVQNQTEQLLTDTAASVTQLLTQAHLLEQGKPVQAKDVLLVAKRLIRSLEDNGLTIVSQVGETVSFDSNLHESLSASSSITPGTEVVVRFAGVSYQGKVIRKAGVE
jgi:molecular chaperone GrpE (heat shock protein)